MKKIKMECRILL